MQRGKLPEFRGSFGPQRWRIACHDHASAKTFDLTEKPFPGIRPCWLRVEMLYRPRISENGEEELSRRVPPIPTCRPFPRSQNERAIPQRAKSLMSNCREHLLDLHVGRISLRIAASTSDRNRQNRLPKRVDSWSDGRGH